MFVAMNKFKIINGKEDAFEDSWRGRDTYLSQFEGFRSFALLRNQTTESGVTEFLSYSHWRSEADFRAWMGSPEFHRAHAQGGSLEGVIAGPPQIALYDGIVEEVNSST